MRPGRSKVTARPVVGVSATWLHRPSAGQFIPASAEQHRRPRMRKFAPVPEFARGPDIPDAGYRVTELGGGAYGITSGLVNTMFLVTKHGVVVVDAPPDLGGKLLTGIEEVTPKPVTHLIYSHAHADHIGS